MTEPNTDVIDIWRVDLSDPRIDSHRAILSVDEQLRVDKFVFPNDKNSFARSRCALRLILADYLNCQAGEIVFRYEEHGKPVLSEPPVDSLSFNLSHSEDIGLIAVAQGRRVGVDVNRIGGRTDRKATDWVPIAKRSFSSIEQKRLFSLPQDQQEFAFYRIWTQKEAYTKALGDGFTYGFQTFSVAIDLGSDETFDLGNNAGLLSDDEANESISQWNITSIGNYSSQGNRYVAALAYDGAEAKIRQREFQSEQ